GKTCSSQGPQAKTNVDAVAEVPSERATSARRAPARRPRPARETRKRPPFFWKASATARQPSRALSTPVVGSKRQAPTPSAFICGYRRRSSLDESLSLGTWYLSSAAFVVARPWFHSGASRSLPVSKSSRRPHSASRAFQRPNASSTQ